MNQTERETILNNGMEQVGVRLTQRQIDQFLQYYDLLVEWNQKINLTAITEFEQVVMKHFVDSAALFRIIRPGKDEWLIDVGTGAGFPGIPLKIVCPELNVTLLDSLGKRVRFLENLIDTIGLDQEDKIAAGNADVCGSATAVHGRAEELARDPEHRAQYHYAVSRAVSNISTISEYCVPFLRADGVFIAYKSVDPHSELTEYAGGITILNAETESVDRFSLKMGSETLERSLITIRKLGDTPDKYPRRSGMPEKRPLK